MKPQFRDIRDRLQFVGTSQADYDLSVFPDFMIIGPQRTGTTWLHENLVEHPQVLMPEQKELYYFNTLRNPEYHPSSLPPVDRDLGWYLKFFKPTPQFLAKRDAECRERFGVGYAPKVRGEATATYAALLDTQLIREILLLNPDIKILTMVRDPIERAWSHAKKDLSKNVKRPFADVREEEWLEFFGRWYQVRCGHYSEFHATWKSIVRPENFFVGRFLDVANDPVGLLTRVYAFLGIDADERYVGEVARQRVNPTEGAGLTPTLRARLEELFGDEVARLRAQGLI